MYGTDSRAVVSLGMNSQLLHFIGLIGRCLPMQEQRCTTALLRKLDTPHLPDDNLPNTTISLVPIREFQLYSLM